MSIYPLYCGLAWPTDLVHSLRAVHTLKMWNTNRENIFECFISLRDDDKIFPSKWLLFCSLNSYKCIASFAVLLLVIGKRIAVIRRPEKKRQITARGNLMLFVVLLYWSIAHRFVNSVDIISIQKKTKKKKQENAAYVGAAATSTTVSCRFITVQAHVAIVRLTHLF